jgi:4-hydroxybenzoate polyprenyltransferase
MFATVRAYLEMIRFSHTLFALPFALVSASLAWMDEKFRFVDVYGILLCMVLARSAAMAFNRLVDRNIDARNPRTATRHLPAGRLTVKSVWLFTALCSAAFIVASFVFQLRDPPNPWPFYFSAPLLAWILEYSLTKRYTFLAHFWLGVSLGLAPIATWIAIRGMTDLAPPAVLGLAVFFWVSGFDILYACQDEEYDRAAGLHSVPAKFGVRASLRIAFLCHLGMLGSLIGLYFVSPHLGAVYLCGLAAVAALVLYEHWLVSPNDLSRVNKAFFQVNGVISVGLLGIVVAQLLAK